MMLLLMINLSGYDFLATIITGLAIFVTIIIFIIQIRLQVKNKITESFNELYNRTFELRINVSKALGREWYYDPDSIMSSTVVEEMVLGYLTWCCNMFCSISEHVSYTNLYEKIMSYKLYSRLAALLPYIQNSALKNGTKFEVYVLFIKKFSRFKKVKDHISVPTDITWIGIRKSDIIENTSNKYFSNNIKNSYALFPNNIKTRGNQNLDDIISYYSPLFKESDARYMCYNPKIAYSYGANFVDKTLCLNSQSLLANLNNKIFVRESAAANGIRVPHSRTFPSSELTCELLILFLKKYNNKAILQTAYGSGGIGTAIVTESNVNDIYNSFKDKNSHLILSEYIHNSIPINVHLLLADKSEAIFPPSVQIIDDSNGSMIYKGADFCSAYELDCNIKDMLFEVSIKTAHMLRSFGYKGICGADYLITNDGTIYLLEINPRFQASSKLIELYIKEKSLTLDSKMLITTPNLIEMNYLAFEEIIQFGISFYDKIDHSCYFHFNENDKSNDISATLTNQKRNAQVDLDGFDIKKADKYDNYLKTSSYIYRAIFDHKITQISPDFNIWLLDSIKVTEFEDNLEFLKISLLNQGISLLENNNYKKAVFESIDIYIPKYDLHVNAPINTNYTKYSPYTVRENSNKIMLLYNQAILFEIKIDPITVKKEFSQILYLSTDRLRISPTHGCQLRNDGGGCKFCNLPICSEIYDIEKLKLAYDYSKTLTYDHILIGGGSVKEFANLQTIVDLVKYVKSDNPNMRISLMSIPTSRNNLVLLKDAGINDVSINMEICDEKTAIHLMPLKSVYSREYYFKTLQVCCNLWPEYGRVRSLLIVGLETTENIVQCAVKMTSMGIQPVLSVFRPLPKSDLAYLIPPTNKYLIDLYTEITSILPECKPLGTNCTPCNNNILKF